MAVKPLPSQEVLRQLLRYEPETGKLFWKARAPDMFPEGKGRYTAARSCQIWNTKYSATEAFSNIDVLEGYRTSTIWVKSFTRIASYGRCRLANGRLTTSTTSMGTVLIIGG